jgi:YD repeat-containing protein
VKKYHVMVVISLVCLACLSSFAYADPTRDPFYTEGSSVAAPETNSVYEHVDPFSGILSLLHTDLHLPGNGGLDVNLIRTYNSMIWGRRDVTTPGLIAKNEKSPLGIGWTMHMGIVHNPFGKGSGSDSNFQPDNPIVEMPDGSRHVFYKDKNDSTRFVSKEFWVYKVVTSSSGSGTWELTLSDGTIYTFEFGTGNAGYNVTDDFNTIIDKVAQVTKIRNAVNTSSINIDYYTYTDGYSFLKTITDSASRVITLNYDYSGHKLTSISADSRTINYSYTAVNGNNYLTSVAPPVTSPVSNPWKYGYEASNNGLNSITYPSGGIITYTYNDLPFATGATAVKFRVITGKTTSGRGISSGSWTYSYSSGGSGGDTTTVSAPGVTETHSFYGWGNTGNNNVWKVGLPMSKSFSGAFSLSESYSWSQGTQISNDRIFNANWSGTGGQVYDSYVYVPFDSTKSTTRDGKTYTTTNSTFNTYGDPQSIAESGDISRNRSLTYWTNTTKNIVKNKPATESITGGFPGTSSTSWIYDAISGNLTQVTKNSVSTNYYYNANGNLSSVTDANSHSISYVWTYGKISTETNPFYSISRSINSSGTVASETNGRGYVTSYGYDGLLRATSATPPIGNPYSYSYPADSSYKKETRGGYWIQYNYDGFGRPSGSSDSKGATATIAYTPYGTKSSADSNIGDAISYDYFGRITHVVHKDTNDITYSYSSSNVTVIDENNATATLTYKAFGNPDEKYLTSLYDQDTNTTTYSRNILGNVTGITQGSIGRSFSYNSKYFLDSETNPETGNITYTRDNVGNMTGRTDVTGARSYAYDSINRLTGITAGSSTISFGYDNANNRNSMSSPGSSASYTYDSANRQTQKIETTAGRSYTTGYGYNGNDKIISITYPSTRVLAYGYNSNDEATSITGFGASVTSVLYNSASLPTSYTLSNGLSPSIVYNSRNLTTDITAGSALDVSYGYDSRGNTTSFTNGSYTNQSFGYDSLSRMTSFTGAWGSGSYGYDATGNRNSKAVAGTSTSYSYSNNRVSSTSGGEPASYNYNGDGTLSGGTWQGGNYTLVYDGFDNLTSYKTGSTSLADFTYDGDGLRVTKTANGLKTVYHYDLSGSVISEDNGSGNTNADYVYLNGKLIAKVATVPNISAAPNSNNFGSSYVNTTSAAQTVTITNTNTASELLIGTVTLSGSHPTEFSKTSDTCSGLLLEANGSCTIQVAFAPLSVGAKSVNLSIPSNDPDTPTLTVALSGNAVNPLITVSKDGSGGGTVTSSPSGVSCGGTCSSSFTIGTSVTLQAVADSNSSFTGWSGGGCSGPGSCIVTLSADTTITPTFALLPPVADFAGTPTSGLIPLTVSFTDQSLRANAWVWDFGDNAPTSNLQNPSHIYNQAGIFSVSLQAVGISGSNAKTKTNYITVLNPVTLTVSKSGTGGGVITSTAGISCGSTCSGLYAPGMLVTLQAVPDTDSSFAGWSGGGCSGTGVCTTTLNANTTITPIFTLLPPVAIFSATPTAGVFPLAVTFTDSSVRADSWLWDFGDGTSSTLQNPSHLYALVGPYSVSLTVTNNVSGSNSATKSDFITLTDLPILTVSKTGTGGGNIASIPEGINCGDTCNASFDLGTLVTLLATPGNDSTFTGWSGAGCNGTDTCTVSMDAYADVTANFTVLPAVAAYSAFPTTGVAPFAVGFTDSSSFASAWSWDFGDSSTSSEQNPSHTYSAPGTYMVSLQATNPSGGNTITKSSLVTVNVTPVDGVLIPRAVPVSFSTLQASFDAAQDGETIQSQAVSFEEDLVFSQPTAIILNGGYNGDWLFVAEHG